MNTPSENGSADNPGTSRETQSDTSEFPILTPVLPPEEYLGEKL